MVLTDAKAMFPSRIVCLLHENTTLKGHLAGFPVNGDIIQLTKVQDKPFLPDCRP